MAIEPYLYQVECCECLIEARRDGKTHALVVMASGLGKTITAALDAKNWLEKHGGRLLYLCHQNDILAQAKTTFEFVLGRGYTYGYFHGGEKDRRRASCLFASFQTMRLEKWQKRFGRRGFDYIVVDESHHGSAPTYRPTLDYFRPRFLLGITATPDRTDLQDIREIYGEEIYSLPIEEALARGLLTPVAYYLVTDELQNLAVLDTPIGKLSVKYINKKLFVPRRDEEIARIVRRYMTEVATPRAMIFCPSVAYCDRLATYFPHAFPIHSGLPGSEQRARLDSFRSGIVNTILTVDKFNEGIDVPDANVIVFLRSTASRRIFFQQLGRGLRKFPGKERVVILDFVANCERLEEVHDLWREVEEKRSAYKTHEETPPVSVDVGTVRFTEVAKRVLDIVAAVRRGYTKEMLISQLRRLAQRLGRTPTQDDIAQASKASRCPSPATFYTIFGSLTAAWEATGLPVEYSPSYTRKELIQQLQVLARELGRTPKIAHIREGHRVGKCAFPSTFAKAFGSVTAAQRAAGLRASRRYDYTQKDLIRELRDLAKKLGRTPKQEDVAKACKAGECASTALFGRFFGSLAAAQRAAGLSVTRSHYTKKELLRQLRTLARKLGRTPTQKDVIRAHRRGEYATDRTFFDRFGSFNAALKAAGLPIVRQRAYNRAELTKQLRALARKLRRTPTVDDVAQARKAGRCPGVSTLTKHFGSFSAAQRAAGLPVNARLGYTDVELLQELQQLARRLGRCPVWGDVEKVGQARQCASHSLLRRRFGSFRGALKAAGLVPS